MITAFSGLSVVIGVLVATLSPLNARWIRAARFDPALLPPHLVALHRTTRAAMHN